MVLLLGTKVKGTAAPGNFTQTGLEMCLRTAFQEWCRLLHLESQPKPGLFKIEAGLSTQWEIKYKLCPSPPLSPMSLPDRSG